MTPTHEASGYLTDAGWTMIDERGYEWRDRVTGRRFMVVEAMIMQRFRDSSGPVADGLAAEKRRGMADAWTRAYADNTHGDPSVGTRAAREFGEWFDATFGEANSDRR